MSTTTTIKLGAIERSNGVIWQQVIREGNWVVYKHIDPEHPGVRPFAYRGYEIFKVRKRPARIVKGIELPAQECFPKTEEWGKNAFTCNQEKNAMEYFQHRGHP